MITIPLTWPEVVLATQIGVMRQIQNMRNGAKNQYGATELDAFQRHIVSAHTELALAKSRNCFWNGAHGDYDAADVGDFYEVRGTMHRNGRLRLHDTDKDDKPYVHARLRYEIAEKRCYVDLVGWMYGYEGKRREFWTDPQPGRFAYFVPDQKLHDMTELPISEGIS